MIGKITHYFDKIGVGVIELRGALKVGDKISVEKDGQVQFEQVVDSMQVDKQPVTDANGGQAIGMKLANAPKSNSEVYKVTE